MKINMDTKKISGSLADFSMLGIATMAAGIITGCIMGNGFIVPNDRGEVVPVGCVSANGDRNTFKLDVAISGFLPNGNETLKRKTFIISSEQLLNLERAGKDAGGSGLKLACQKETPTGPFPHAIDYGFHVATKGPDLPVLGFHPTVVATASKDIDALETYTTNRQLGCFAHAGCFTRVQKADGPA